MLMFPLAAWLLALVLGLTGPVLAQPPSPVPPLTVQAPAQGTVTITITVETQETPPVPVPPVPPVPVADTLPPSTPTQVVATALSPTQINLTWGASSDNLAVTGYHVTRDGVRLSPAAGLSLLVTDLAPSTTYAFTVAAYDAAGNLSAPTLPLSATTLVLPPDQVQVEFFRTHHDRIPNFAQHVTVQSVQSGVWSDAASWAPARVPGPTDIVLVRHAITYDAPSGDVDTIGIETSGVLAFATTQRTQLTLRTLLVMPGGTLRLGTAVAPLPAQFTAEILFKDLPIDPTRDPSQFGHGLAAVDGTVTMHGAQKAPAFVRLALEPKAGDTLLLLAQAPVGWQAGDRLVVPDTRQLTGAEVQPNDQEHNVRRFLTQSEVVTIGAITGPTVTLAAPLRYDHLGARDTAGILEFLPHVGNLSRNIVIRSANPAGVRGHTLFTGVSDIDIRHVALVNLGRTLAEPLDSTTFNEQRAVVRIGTNQIGRYPLHNHHNFGPCGERPYQFAYVGNVVEESGRWGITVHGSHYGFIQDNIVYNVKGAGIATEDGSETNNLFEHNFIVGVENTTQMTPAEANSNTDPLGRRGNGFWLRGPGSILRNNVIADTREGIGMYTGSEEGGFPDGPEMPVRVPAYRCANTHVAGQYTTVEKVFQVPNQEFSGNEIYSTSEMGLGIWVNTGEGQPFRNTTIWHAHGMALFMKYTDPRIEGLVIRNQRGEGVAIHHFNNFGPGGAVLRQADIQGVDVVYQRGGQLTLAPNVTVAESMFASRRGFLLDANGQENGYNVTAFLFKNVRFLALPGLPLKTMTTRFAHNGDRVNIPRRIRVVGYQGDPADHFQVYFAAQAPGAPAYHLPEFPDLGPLLSGCRVPLTNQACWDQYGIATFMQVAPCTDTTTHPEIGGFTCP